MQTRVPYKPFSEINGFYVTDDNGSGERTLIHDNGDARKNLMLRLPEGGFPPKLGLLFWDLLQDRCVGKTVLDLGAGAIGILAVSAAVAGASHVDAVDINPACGPWLRVVADENQLTAVTALTGNLYEPVQNRSYDLILSNPPQMPMTDGALHDAGGLDGRSTVVAVLQDARAHLSARGELLISLFNFLGLEQRTSDTPSLKEIAADFGLSKFEVLRTVDHEILPGSVTMNSLDHIKQIYPLYPFEVRTAGPVHQISLIKFAV